MSATKLIIDSVAGMTAFKEEQQLADSLVGVICHLMSLDVVILAEVLSLDRGCGLEAHPTIVAPDGTAVGGSEEGNPESLNQVILRNFQLLAGRCLETQGIEQFSANNQWASVFPIFRDRKIGYLLYVLNSPLSKEEQDLLVGILQIFFNHLEILSEGKHDSLTGLLNRKVFLDKVRRTIELASLNQHSFNGAKPHPERRQNHEGIFWLGLFDIDHFKKINDSYGHIYGDEVLILMSDLMRSTFRVGDQLFRYGGEEFVVMIGPMQKETAISVFERFRRSVANKQFGRLQQVTVSIGVTKIDVKDDPNGVVGFADQAMYYAKENGRNRLAVYEDLIECGGLALPEVNEEVEFF